jgi:hypothetical protein
MATLQVIESPTPNLQSTESASTLHCYLIMSSNKSFQARSAAPVPIAPNGRAVQRKVISSPSSSANPAKIHRSTCMCSPTTHPGSFRCTLHRKYNTSPPSAHSQFNAKRSSMTNSRASFRSVEGEWVRRALTALIRPSSHHMQRRTSFQPRPSRLRHMTRAEDVC